MAQYITQEALEVQKTGGIPFSATLTISITEGQQSFQFPENEISLTNKNVIGFYIRFQNSGGTAKASNGKDILSNALADKAFLILHGCDRDFIKKVPLRMFDTTGKPMLYVPMFSDGITLTSSYIFFGQNVPAGTDQVVEITFVYF
jgi:hypothetical protein